MTTPNEYLLTELARVKAEGRILRTDRDRLRRSRDRWRAEARAWKWGAMQSARRGEDVQASSRAEAS